MRRNARWLVVSVLGFLLIMFIRLEPSDKLCSCDTTQKESAQTPWSDDKFSAISENVTGMNRVNREKRHVVYIRIPKTGSSTVAMMIWQFAWRRNLSVLTSHPHWAGTRGAITERFFYLPPPNTKMNMMAEHVLFNLNSYYNYFHPDTAFVTMLREPMAMLVSTLYYVPEFRKEVPGTNKVESYLQNPGKYDRLAIKDISRADRSFTRNPQSAYFGLKEKKFNNSAAINTLISFMGADLALVMILERLDESLVLLKRTLGWSFLDVFPSEQNFNENHKKPELNVTAEQKQRYREWSTADHFVYEFFYRKLDETVQKLGAEFQKEVEIFRKVRKEMSRFCRYEAILGGSLKVPGSPYNEPFRVTVDDCILHRTEALVLVGMIRKRQGYFPYLHRSLEKDGNAA